MRIFSKIGEVDQFYWEFLFGFPCPKPTGVLEGGIQRSLNIDQVTVGYTRGCQVVDLRSIGHIKSPLTCGCALGQCRHPSVVLLVLLCMALPYAETYPHSAWGSSLGEFISPPR